MKNTKRPKSQIIVRGSVQSGDIGRNHPENQLLISEPLKSMKLPVSASLPLTTSRTRK